MLEFPNFCREKSWGFVGIFAIFSLPHGLPPPLKLKCRIYEWPE